MGKSNKTEEFLKLNPWGKVPTLETAEGGIWESNAIARYVAKLSDDHTLFGKSPFEYGQVEQWIDWVRGDLELAGSVWLYPIYGLIPNNPKATENAKQDIRKAMGILNNYLANKSFLVGDDVTLADIVVACSLTPLYTKVFDEAFRQGFENVNNWFLNIINQPNFLKVQPEFSMCSKMEVANQKPKQEANEQPKEESKEESKEETKEETNEEPKKETNEEPKKEPNEEQENKPEDNNEQDDNANPIDDTNE